MKLSPEELLEEWEGEEGESTGMSPHRAQYLREELMEYTGRYFPHRIPELESYLETMRGPITKELREAVEEREEDESEETQEEDDPS